MSQISHMPVESTPTGCYYSGVFGVSALFWLPALVYEPMLCVLILWKAWGEDLLANFRLDLYGDVTEKERGGNARLTTPPLVKRMARERIFIELMGSTLIWALFNRDINIIMPWSCALPSILGSRLFLNMREIVLKAGEEDSYVLETLVFRPSAHVFTPPSPSDAEGQEQEREENDRAG
ncbi:hypothetical protein PHLCEN_2v12038 [Hermanssonia centrifuga]|uniref:Uncharacterized protein n=1 Tax=Hermanssonia centrifuga TaxID=98765 RepID=A0A2R6NI61_9APHY|nr:hypothetical protein PHLCEN_2v12038 [Hermanssonia centrifuga]